MSIEGNSSLDASRARRKTGKRHGDGEVYLDTTFDRNFVSRSAFVSLADSPSSSPAHPTGSEAAGAP
jgi:hypothetical protein